MSIVINKISVICPIYNFETFVNQLCNSLINQDFKIYEIIFINDGSTDNTLQRLNAFKSHFKKKNIKIKIITINNKGPGYSRNIGINNSTGDWIAFIDADDTWEFNKLSKVNNVINKYQINTVLHYEKFYINNKYKGILEHGGNFKNFNNLSKKLYMNNFFSTSALVFKRELLIKDQFDKKLSNAQDYELWLRISKKIKICIIREALGNYNLNSRSISNKFYINRFFNLLIVYFRHRKLVNYNIFIYNILTTLFSKQWLLDILKILKLK